MEMDRTVAFELQKPSSSVFLLHKEPSRKRPDAWSAAGQAIELACLQPHRLGFAERAVIALALALAARLGWGWS
jgi:hypothetical protein